MTTGKSQSTSVSRKKFFFLQAYNIIEVGGKGGIGQGIRPHTWNWHLLSSLMYCCTSKCATHLHKSVSPPIISHWLQFAHSSLMPHASSTDWYFPKEKRYQAPSQMQSTCIGLGHDRRSKSKTEEKQGFLDRQINIIQRPTSLRNAPEHGIISERKIDGVA